MIKKMIAWLKGLNRQHDEVIQSQQVVIKASTECNDIVCRMIKESME